MHSRMTPVQEDMLDYYLRSKHCVKDVKVYDRTGYAVVIFTERSAVITALSAFSYEDKETAALVSEHSGRELDREFSDKLMKRINANYRTIIGFNFGLMVFGTAGVLVPTTSAFLNNFSTLAISVASMRIYLGYILCDRRACTDHSIISDTDIPNSFR